MIVYFAQMNSKRCSSSSSSSSSGSIIIIVVLFIYYFFFRFCGNSAERVPVKVVCYNFIR